MIHPIDRLLGWPLEPPPQDHSKRLRPSWITIRARQRGIDKGLPIRFRIPAEPLPQNIDAVSFLRRKLRCESPLKSSHPPSDRLHRGGSTAKLFLLVLLLGPFSFEHKRAGHSLPRADEYYGKLLIAPR